jgi:hypothetical protein
MFSIWQDIPRFRLPSGILREIAKPESGWSIWFKFNVDVEEADRNRLAASNK